MPPKADQGGEATVITVRVLAGDPSGLSSLAPKIGPLGLSPKKIGDDIMAATAEWKGMKVSCRLTIRNRQAEIEVIPSAANLIIKALNEPPRERRKKIPFKHKGNLTLDQIKEMATIMRPRSLSKKFEGTVLQILGTCLAIGATVDGQSPKEITRKIKNKEIIIEDPDN
ncbi:ribosomal protein L12 [Anaeramoeba ignava]|uniref:Ribosomal protein L12 n=1 Tax=Anaeramoeba ignava TaxID=1746090 RepID=A0A9Q0RC58_ANAIG|nr:ribosomal protein L12 [Anaeramoeba ignava]|eukprot:Anaeramoba_ignava/a358074_314.p1 GENE.a358074_314~~a358074_314.p1  ORF type:complete len:183 (+),score=60.10 a358074_314:43-549(+)